MHNHACLISVHTRLVNNNMYGRRERVCYRQEGVILLKILRALRENGDHFIKLIHKLIGYTPESNCHYLKWDQ